MLINFFRLSSSLLTYRTQTSVSSVAHIYRTETCGRNPDWYAQNWDQNPILYFWNASLAFELTKVALGPVLKREICDEKINNPFPETSWTDSSAVVRAKGALERPSTSPLLTIFCFSFFTSRSHPYLVAHQPRTAGVGGFWQTGEAFMERVVRLSVKKRLSSKKGVHKRLISSIFFVGWPSNKWKSLQKITFALPYPLQEALSPSTNEGTLCVCPPLTKTSLCYVPSSSLQILA